MLFTLRATFSTCSNFSVIVLRSLKKKYVADVSDTEDYSTNRLMIGPLKTNAIINCIGHRKFS